MGRCKWNAHIKGRHRKRHRKCNYSLTPGWLAEWLLEGSANRLILKASSKARYSKCFNILNTFPKKTCCRRKPPIIPLSQSSTLIICLRSTNSMALARPVNPAPKSNRLMVSHLALPGGFLQIPEAEKRTLRNGATCRAAFDVQKLPPVIINDISRACVCMCVVVVLFVVGCIQRSPCTDVTEAHYSVYRLLLFVCIVMQILTQTPAASVGCQAPHTVFIDRSGFWLSFWSVQFFAHWHAGAQS